MSKITEEELAEFYRAAQAAETVHANAVKAIFNFGDDDVTPVSKPEDDDAPLDWSGFWPSGGESLRDKRKREGTCPDCGHRGEWIGLALICPNHGRFAG